MTVATFIFPGAGGGPRIDLFRTRTEDVLIPVKYPGWEESAGLDVSPEPLIAKLAAQIMTHSSSKVIRILGTSIGGHLGYATAHLLQKQGYTIDRFCAVDSFMIHSAAVRAGWIQRPIFRVWTLLLDRNVFELGLYLRSMFWRGLIRIAGNHLPRLISLLSLSKRGLRDRILDDELSMRLLIRGSASWISSFDERFAPLYVPATFLRTRDHACDDAAWRRRCPLSEFVEIPGDHYTFAEPKNLDAFRSIFAQSTTGWRS